MGQRAFRASRIAALCLTASAATIGFHAREARACGGCFHPPPTPTQVESVITDHRMVFSISPTQTVLWDQVRYSGDPLEFAWALPVRPGTRIELSTDAWLAALDASTRSVITGPTPPVCPGSFGGGGGGGSVGCGSSSATSLASASDPGSRGGFDGGAGVTVVNQETVGPYEAVTLRSTNGNALNTWLAANNFDIPAAIQPTIDAYVAEGFDFIALKLRPGQGVRAMQPVRIVTPGADASLPLRMVAAGVGANVGLTLYVISEGRYQLQNFPNVAVDFTKLTWDPALNESNFEALSVAAMATGNNRGWLTETAAKPETVATIPPGGLLLSAGSNNPGLADAYLSQCHLYVSRPACDAGVAPVDSGAPPDDSGADAAGDGMSDAALADAAQGSDAEPDASSPPPSCLQNPPDSCEFFDDLDVALTGMHLQDVWVTRLRAFLPANALGAGDLRLEPAPDQVAVTNVHHTDAYVDPKYNPCPGSSGASPSSGSDGCACTTGPETRSWFGTSLLLGATLLGLSSILRRRRS